jgi:hypothetical protein
MPLHALWKGHLSHTHTHTHTHTHNTAAAPHTPPPLGTHSSLPHAEAVRFDTGLQQGRTAAPPSCRPCAQVACCNVRRAAGRPGSPCTDTRRPRTRAARLPQRSARHHHARARARTAASQHPPPPHRSARHPPCGAVRRRRVLSGGGALRPLCRPCVGALGGGLPPGHPSLRGISQHARTAVAHHARTSASQHARTAASQHARTDVSHHARTAVSQHARTAASHHARTAASQHARTAVASAPLRTTPVTCSLNAPAQGRRMDAAWALQPGPPASRPRSPRPDNRRRSALSPQGASHAPLSTNTTGPFPVRRPATSGRTPDTPFRPHAI